MNLAEAQEWIDARLAESGVARSGDAELVRSRPWGEVASATTDRGRVYLKAPGPETAFEVPLYGVLGRVAPDLVLQPIALDEERGWVLLPDGGEPVGDALEGPEKTEAIILALGRYGDLQRRVESHAAEIVDLGIADFSPARLSERLEDAFAAARATAPGDAGGLASLEDRRDEIERWIGELRSRPGPPTLDHNDLHPWNILGRPEDPGTIRFYDWGDSVVQHPFAAAALPLGFVERNDPAELPRAIDSYLEPFGQLGSRAELAETLELACRTSRIARTMTWQRAIATGAEPRFASAPYETLESIFDDSWTSRT